MIQWDDFPMKQELSIPRLAQNIATEGEAYLFLEGLRWADGVVCPHCGATGRCFYLNPDNGNSRKTTRGTVSQRRVWKCGDCRKQFSVLTGTIFHGTHISVRTWLLVIFEMCSSKNGVSAREIERKYELTAKTAWFMLHRIREAMKREPLAGLLSGVVMADETFLGGKPGNMHAVKRPRWESNKTAVFSLVEKETGATRSQIIPNVRGTTLRKAIEDNVNMAESALHTDGLKAYLQVAPDMKLGHESVNHEAGEYVRGDVTTNHVEGYFSQLKRSLDGTFHHVSVEHLPRYLAQFDFLRTNCEDTDTERMRKVVDNSGGRRLSYKPLTDQA
jgi:transposase-like protein